jgi:hypothetical protein
MAQLRQTGGLAPRSALPGDTPVLLAEEAGGLDAKAMAAALVRSGLALSRDGEILRPPVPGERERALLRRAPASPLSPSAQDTGAIGAGGAILFGQILEPPFVVEVAGEQVLLNGLAIYPPAGAAGAPPAPTAAQTAAHDALEAAGAAYFADLQALGPEAARARLAAAMRARPGVAALRWEDESTLVLTTDAGGEQVLSLDPEAREPDPDNAAALGEHLQNLAEGLRRVLVADGTVVAGASYLRTVGGIAAGALRARLIQIRDSPEPELLKLARLQAWTGQREAAADLLYLR